MLSIRLSRVGKKKQPIYRLVVCEKSKDPWGKIVENVGLVNPMTTPATITLKKERIEHWISKGAQPTDTVWNLFIDEKLVEGEKRKKVKISKKRKVKLAKKSA
ncbi:30S ribosomal protein S16 [Candidatus Uhrbacteria bacterium]|nr:30S ribosomal protein S16 [Candidatus Uhrbacteria bacterium]